MVLQAFDKIDKKDLIQTQARIIYQAVQNNTALIDPSVLSQFNLLVFADLKVYKFYFWFCLPVLLPDIHFESASPPAYLSQENPKLVVDTYKSLRARDALTVGCSHHVFMSVLSPQASGASSLLNLADGWSRRYESGSYIFILDSQPATSSSSQSASTTEAAKGTFGWGMRNLLYLLASKHDQKAATGKPHSSLNN